MNLQDKIQVANALEKSIKELKATVATVYDTGESAMNIAESAYNLGKCKQIANNCKADATVLYDYYKQDVSTADKQELLPAVDLVVIAADAMLWATSIVNEYCATDGHCILEDNRAEHALICDSEERLKNACDNACSYMQILISHFQDQAPELDNIQALDVPCRNLLDIRPLIVPNLVSPRLILHIVPTILCIENFRKQVKSNPPGITIAQVDQLSELAEDLLNHVRAIPTEHDTYIVNEDSTGWRAITSLQSDIHRVIIQDQA